ncbi:hypothetical protein GXW71_26560 [Roseomonas hellenica]|uniref:Uncharacterized protein n=1 Tax=Plastoroseomonas hellenica TaxID=2687306 RepID=A0ABS5F5U7_9PROT|nr:hypothetical protein [Plastoroseomonas hellenica]MBR0667945.1 hypothetical protein [Plastoroseomonas hellenica]
MTAPTAATMPAGGVGGFFGALGAFAAQAQSFKAHLKTAGFNPDDLGIF